jgi:predicted ester cyclase
VKSWWRTLSELDQLCTPDMVDHALAPGRPAGIAGTREFLSSAGRNWGGNWTEVASVAENDLVVQFGNRDGHWPGGSFRGFEIPSGPHNRDVAFMYRLVDGRIAERWAVRDDLTMLIQLGAVKPE